MNKDTSNTYPIHPILKKRWSPRAFLDISVEKEKLQSLFEAARWSPSAGNQQPWRFIIGFKGDESYKKIFDSLAKGNKDWAFRAPVLVVSVGRQVLNTDESKANATFMYDVGQSVAHLTFQAAQEGLCLHQMTGFDNEIVRMAFEIPFPYEPISVFVIGYQGEPEILENEVLIKREKEPRVRKDFNEIIFSGKFGNPADLFNNS